MNIPPVTPGLATMLANLRRKLCPDCGELAVVRSSRRDGQCQERYLLCRSCGRRWTMAVKQRTRCGGMKSDPDASGPVATPRVRRCRRTEARPAATVRMVATLFGGESLRWHLRGLNQPLLA